jgi:hypothetical protein
MFLKNEAAIFEKRFWRDFYRSLLTHTVRNALMKLLLIALAGTLVLVPHPVHAATPANVVVLLDLTRSVDVSAHEAKRQYEQNV